MMIQATAPLGPGATSDMRAWREPDIHAAGEAAEGQQTFPFVQQAAMDVLLRMSGEGGITATRRNRLRA